MPPKKKLVLEVEFSAYKPYSGLVETMVNCDLPFNAVELFYTSKNPYLIKYYPNFDQAMLYLHTNEGIVATTIEFKSKDMLQQESDTGKTHSHTHALCLVKKETYYYLFDPNGPVMPGQGDDYHKYIYEGLSCTSQEFITRLCSKYNIPTDRFVYENDKVGIQAFAPDLVNTAFITQGGYCMFYLLWFINYVSFNWTHDAIAAVITYKYSPRNSGIFPLKNDVPEESRKVVLSIFGTANIPSVVCPPDI